MEFSTAKKNLELLTKMCELVQEIDGMPTGDIEDALNEGIGNMKTQLQWSLVYHLTGEGMSDDILFEGPACECADYIIDHPELKGHCIITASY